jgi:F420-dependent oxidoreductase-like protein
MDLGIMLEGQEGLDWGRWRRYAQRVEALGYESLWRSDHFFSLMGRSERDALETWVSLADLAAHTSRLRFGPLVCSMTFREPSLLARMAAAVDDLSGGRLVLGVGAGWNEREHEAFGLPFPPVGKRMDMLEEGIQVLQALFTGEKVSFSGKHYSLKDAEMHPRPVQHPGPPLLVGGGGEKRTLQIVARYADEWNGFAPSAELYKQKLAVLERHCEAARRDPATIKRSVMAAFIVGRDAAEIRHRAEGIQGVLTAMAQTPVEQLPEMMRARGWLVGTPSQVIEQIKELEALGISRIMLQHHNQADEEVVDLIAREIMPAVA